MIRAQILIIGLDPDLIDFTGRTDLTPEFIRTSIAAAISELTALGFGVRSCLINDADAAEAQVQAQLAPGPVDIIMIGAGLRARTEHTVLFERVLNLLHSTAPSARFCFNTNPTDTIAAVQRWVPELEGNPD